MKSIMTYKHVIGAQMAINFLKSQNIPVELNHDACEGNAKILVTLPHYSDAKKIHDEWLKDIRLRIGKIGFSN